MGPEVACVLGVAAVVVPIASTLGVYYQHRRSVERSEQLRQQQSDPKDQQPQRRRPNS